MSVSKTVNNSEPAETEKRGKWRRIALPLATVFLGIGITAVLFLFRDKVAELGNYGYLGAFLISLITSATVLLPVPGIVALFALGVTLNPVLVGLVGATGGIIGEMTGFMVGYGGREAIPQKSRLYLRLEQLMRRWGTWAIIGITAIPLPIFDVAGLVAGALHYPLWKFLLIGWVGKSIKLILLVLAGARGWEAILRFFE
jgi:membrane protein YqaA with SNARE-associated domain